MDEPNLPISSSPQSDLDLLREQVESLRQLVVSILILSIVITGAFDLFLLRQYRYAHADLLSIKPQAEQIMAGYQKGGAAAMDEFVRRISLYGQTNKDFAPYMAKYGLNRMQSNAAPSAAVPPAIPPQKK